MFVYHFRRSCSKDSTNDESDRLNRLKAALKAEGWHTIRASRDFVLDQEQTDVGMAIDMELQEEQLSSSATGGSR
ncbi:hypothetical protein WG66_003683 [Moniliophthora roreri]|nr:hypothetical protein WG66_003683 [Moniliophthora roreri]